MFENYGLGKSILQHLCDIGIIICLPQKDYGNETVYYVPMHLKPWTIKKTIVPCRKLPSLGFSGSSPPCTAPTQRHIHAITSSAAIWLLLALLTPAHAGQAAVVLGWCFPEGDKQSNRNSITWAQTLRCQGWISIADSTAMIDPINTPEGSSFSQASSGIIASSVTMPKCLFCISTKVSVLSICCFLSGAQLSF